MISSPTIKPFEVRGEMWARGLAMHGLHRYHKVPKVEAILYDYILYLIYDNLINLFILYIYSIYIYICMYTIYIYMYMYMYTLYMYMYTLYIQIPYVYYIYKEDMMRCFPTSIWNQSDFFLIYVPWNTSQLCILGALDMASGQMKATSQRTPP